MLLLPVGFNYTNHNVSTVLPLNISYPANVEGIQDCVQASSTVEMTHQLPNKDALSKSQKWCLAILFTSVINITSLSGIIFKPILHRPLFAWLLIWMIGLGVGSMCSVSILQLIPESLDIDTKSHIPQIIVIIASIYAFYLADKLTCLIRYKEQCCLAVERHQIVNVDSSCNAESIARRNNLSVRKLKIKEISTAVWLIVICDSLHNFVDGLTIAAALSSGYKEGFAIFLAILFEEIPCEIGDFAVFMKSGLSLSQALFFNFTSSVTNYLGIIIGFMISASINMRSWIYGVAAGMFIYISLGVLLIELNDQEKRVAAKHSYEATTTKRLAAIILVQNFGILSGFLIQMINQNCSKLLATYANKSIRRHLTRVSLEELRDRAIKYKATMDHLPKPSGNWQEYWTKRYRMLNNILYGGLIFLFASFYGTYKLGILGSIPCRAPYHLVGHEPFPGFRYDDVTDEDVDRLEGVDTS
ncbi:hypothetical protein GJ496_010305 [Pomphorhynchus laevis]|nr:hypothetical protein GJ496_010305 [Pomphorhynchus laevis]